MIGFTRFCVVTVGLIGLLSNSPSAQAQSPAAQPPPQDGRGAWDNETFERQALREEMQQIRKEHEDLQSEHEQWESRCHTAPDTTCDTDQKALNVRREKLRERVHALREKIESDHAARGESPTLPTSSQNEHDMHTH